LEVIGHRGYPARFPENSVASLLAALLAGAHGVEFDVWLSRDGTPVLLHDPDTGRVSTSGQSIAVREATVRQLRGVCLGMGQCIPTLAEALDALPRGISIFLEIKDPGASEAIYHMVREKRRLNDTVFISFHPEALEAVRRLDSEARLGFTIMSLEHLQMLWGLHERLRLYTVNPPILGVPVVGLETYRSLVAEARRRGMKIAIWTVNRPEELRGLEDLVDYVITDDPAAWPQRRNCGHNW